MTAAERRQQERRLVELFMRQRGANECNDRALAYALFGQIRDVLAPDRCGLAFDCKAERMFPIRLGHSSHDGGIPFESTYPEKLENSAERGGGHQWPRRVARSCW